MRKQPITAAFYAMKPNCILTILLIYLHQLCHTKKTLNNGVGCYFCN